MSSLFSQQNQAGKLLIMNQSWHAPFTATAMEETISQPAPLVWVCSGSRDAIRAVGGTGDFRGFGVVFPFFVLAFADNQFL